MDAFTTPRSPAIERLIERTKSLAAFLPAHDDADDGLFPPAYIEGGSDLDRALDSLGLQLDDTGPRINLPGIVAGLVFYGFAVIGVAGLLWGALDFVLWALGSFGRPA